MTNKTKKILLTIPAVLIAITIFILSHQSKLPHIDFGVEWTDKILHFIAYFCYGLALITAFASNYPEWKHIKVILFVIIIGSLYGASDEFHQSFIPNRTSDVFDWMADTTGIVVSLAFMLVIRKIIRKLS